MKKKIIICTTAIIRGDYQQESIGLFYDRFNKYLDGFEVIHIINIDKPNQLLNYFLISQTIELFNKIIPLNITKIIIENNQPSFLSAFKNIMHKIEELNFDTQENIFWWFEDDWKPKQNYNIFQFHELFSITNTAVSFTEKADLGSFKAGPIMSGSYFDNFFNIEKIGVMNQTCDPERQVNRWLSGIKRTNGKQMIERVLGGNNTIQIVFLFLGNEKIILKKLPFAYYTNKLKFNKSIKFEFHIVKSDLDFINIQHSLINPLSYKYKLTKILKLNYKYKLTKILKTELLQLFDNENIKYFIIKPDVFEDIGRIFNEKYGLKKWEKIQDNATYL